MQALALMRKEIGVSKHLHITHLNEPSIFEMDNGQVGSTFAVSGIPFDTQSNDSLNRLRRTLHDAIAILGEDFCIYSHTFRKRLYDIQLPGKFTNDFCVAVDKEYHAQFDDKYLYKNEHYITLIFKGMTSGKAGKGLSLVQKISHKAIKSARAEYRAKAVARLKKARETFEANTIEFKPKLLGLDDESRGYSELLAFHGELVNALDRFCFRAPHFASPFVKGVNGASKEFEKYPNGNVAQYLPAKRIFFGDAIEFRGANGKSKFGAMLSIRRYGEGSFAGMLNSHMRLDCEYIHTNTFLTEPDAIGIDKIDKKKGKLKGANDHAVSQIEALAECQDDLASQRIRVGYHHNTMMILADDLDMLKEQMNKAIKDYSDIGAVAVEETLGLEPAFWAQMPGNQRYIARSAMITSQNFTDFAPLHNFRTGYRDKNHLGGALSLVQSPSNTPIFFNWHSRGSGSRKDLTPGHATLIGGNGSGKTVFMAFMDSQMDRYGGRTFIFDRDQGLEIYCRATGGTYIKIDPDHAQEVQFNPFQLPDTPKNRAFLRKWLSQLLLADDELFLPVTLTGVLGQCVDYCYTLNQEERTLRHATAILPEDFPRWEHLNRWLKDEEGDNHGDQAYLFDNPIDALSLNDAKVGFDFTYLMDRESNHTMTAVCMYIMHRVEEQLNGQRVTIFFDEGWQILNSPYWKGQLAKSLPTYRKINCHLVLATQSPKSVRTSEISAIFFDNCATNIFFCNPTADLIDYKAFGVSDTEFEFIKTTPLSKRFFLYKQKDESAVAKLNLTGMDETLAVFSGNRETALLLNKIIKTCGNDPRVWLPVFHVECRALEEELHHAI